MYLTVCCCIISVILFSYCSPSIVIFLVCSSLSFFTAAFCCDLAVCASVCSFRALYCFCWILTASWNCRRIWSSFCCNTIHATRTQHVTTDHVWNTVLLLWIHIRMCNHFLIQFTIYLVVFERQFMGWLISCKHVCLCMQSRVCMFNKFGSNCDARTKCVHINDFISCNNCVTGDHFEMDTKGML